MRKTYSSGMMLTAAATALLSIVIFAWSGNSSRNVEQVQPATSGAAGGAASFLAGNPAVQDNETAGSYHVAAPAREAAGQRAVQRVLRNDWGRVEVPPTAAEIAATEKSRAGGQQPFSDPSQDPPAIKAPLPVILASGGTQALASVAAGATSAEGKVQAAALDQMEKDFTKAVTGDSAPNAEDPAYAGQWQEAQELSDAAFRSKFGWQAFMERQLAAVQNSVDE